jgi:hypothetical protein
MACLEAQRAVNLHSLVTEMERWRVSSVVFTLPVNKESELITVDIGGITLSTHIDRSIQDGPQTTPTAAHKFIYCERVDLEFLQILGSIKSLSCFFERSFMMYKMICHHKHTYPFLIS